MKLNYLLLMLGLASLLLVSCERGGSVSQPSGSSVVQPSKSPVAETSVDPATESAIEGKLAAVKSGTFVKAEQPTQGTASIVNENGKRYLELAQNFNTSDKGPDLHVILHRSDTLPISGLKEKDYVIVGRLQKFSGAQRYAIPDNVNLADFRSAAIWCRKFNATFGYAKLSS